MKSRSLLRTFDTKELNLGTAVPAIGLPIATSVDIERPLKPFGAHHFIWHRDANHLTVWHKRTGRLKHKFRFTFQVDTKYDYDEDHQLLRGFTAQTGISISDAEREIVNGMKIIAVKFVTVDHDTPRLVTVDGSDGKYMVRVWNSLNGSTAMRDILNTSTFLDRFLYSHVAISSTGLSSVKVMMPLVETVSPPPNTTPQMIWPLENPLARLLFEGQYSGEKQPHLEITRSERRQPRQVARQHDSPENGLYVRGRWEASPRDCQRRCHKAVIFTRARVTLSSIYSPKDMFPLNEVDVETKPSTLSHIVRDPSGDVVERIQLLSGANIYRPRFYVDKFWNRGVLADALDNVNFPDEHPKLSQSHKTIHAQFVDMKLPREPVIFKDEWHDELITSEDKRSLDRPSVEKHKELYVCQRQYFVLHEHRSQRFSIYHHTRYSYSKPTRYSQCHSYPLLHSRISTNPMLASRRIPPNTPVHISDRSFIQQILLYI
ncbi:hypothetical protein BC938DRAFT_470893 [Jimgerdemannia flammicorona]|uniref:Uncharacterized protein n=1 Tax=Jimgerdemannia flammicorona TaxID=994334 RepID=A0A433Q992_9FUNG|nr:hypothetical protein BC938DRAFT_470893 [Jimgerdemannia flammicorona]